MKKFFVYFLLFLIIASLALLAFGFWNAKNIRRWAIAADDIKVRHAVSAKEKDFAGRLNTSGVKKAEDFKAELEAFISDLALIESEKASARKQTNELACPSAAKMTAGKLIAYYDDGEVHLVDLGKVLKYVKQVFEVAIINDKMKPEMNIEEITAVIAEAKAKSGEIDTYILPQDMQSAGADLKAATENYLDQFDQFATGKVENHEGLNVSYANFSDKLNNFLLQGKSKYIESMKTFEASDAMISGELMALERVKFKIK